MTVKGALTIVLVDLLLPAACILNIYLYFYPVLYGCAFPSAPTFNSTSSIPAPFRLLALADPQIEGSNKLRKYARPPPIPNTPSTNQTLLPFPLTQRVMEELYFTGLTVRKYAKKLDLWGNDLYLSHVYKTVKKHTHPTHVAVLGDLLGSQWISDDEFSRRGKRFWKKIFSDTRPVSLDDVARGTAHGDGWLDKIITMPGNHDIGYAGDMTRARLNRFEDVFGPDNYWLIFHSDDGTAQLRIAVLNSLTLDGPMFDPGLGVASREFLSRLQSNFSADSTQATVLLTHLPLHKPTGVCADGPETLYFPPENGGGVRSQNFLSPGASDLLKERVFGLPDPSAGGKSRGVILTGHDHEGCLSDHYWDDDKREWAVSSAPFSSSSSTNSKNGAEGKKEVLQEITVKSMMGEYGGNAGLLSAWYEKETKEWKFKYSYCALGVQQLWWTTHVVNVICAILAALLGLVTVIGWVGGVFGVNILGMGMGTNGMAESEKKKQ